MAVAGHYCQPTRGTDMIARVVYLHHDYLVGCGIDFIGILDIFPLFSYHMPYPDMISVRGSRCSLSTSLGILDILSSLGLFFFFRYSWSVVAGHPRSPLAAFEGFEF